MNWSDQVRQQFGVVSFAQAVDAGFTPAEISRKLRTCEWRRHGFGEGLYIVREVDNGFEQDCMAALLYLGPKAVLSHRCAGKLLGLDSCEAPDVEVTIPHKARKPVALGGVRVHQSRRPEETDIVNRGGLRFTGLVRTIIDLDAVAERFIVVAAYEHAFRMNRRNRRRISERLEELSAGRRTPSVLRELVARRSEADPPTANQAEAWCDDLLCQHGIVAKRQYVLTRQGKFVARVDFALPELFYAIEFDGFGTHHTRASQRADAARKLKLSSIGWDVGTLTYTDVIQPGDGIKDIVASVELRRSRFARAAG